MESQIKRHKNSNKQPIDKEVQIWAELARHTEQLENVHARLSSMEAMSARAHSDLILQDIFEGVGRSDIRAKIIELTQKEATNAGLRKELGLSVTALSNHLKMLIDRGILMPKRFGNSYSYTWAPKLRHIGNTMVLSAANKAVKGER